MNATPSRAWTDTPKGQLPAPEVCIICLEELETDSDYRQLPCKHLFHQPCINDWVCTRDTRCPLCCRYFYELCRPREKQISPSVPLYLGRTSENRHGNEAVLGRFNSLKGWCRKKPHGQIEVVRFPPTHE